MLAVSLPLVAFTPRPRPHGPASMRSWGPQAGPSKPLPMSTSEEAPNGELLGDVVGDTSNEAIGSEVKVEETVCIFLRSSYLHHSLLTFSMGFTGTRQSQLASS